MGRAIRGVCLHAHFYQPPREDPWLGVVPPEPSAAPDRDWNARITRECYAPHGAARILSEAGRLTELVNLYAWMSFNVGPTLAAWLEGHAPGVMQAMRAGDAASLERTGHGNAWAQVWGHAILPLSTPADVALQVAWGVADFRSRFGRHPEGMWLSEMAVDVAALEALAASGVTMTILAPHQIAQVRPLGGHDGEWTPAVPGALDVHRLYRCPLPSGRSIDIVLRHAELSRDLAFGALLRDGAMLTAGLRHLARGMGEGGLVAAATDGETFGHHHRHGEMAIAYAVRALMDDPEVTLLGPAAFRDHAPPRDEVAVVEGSSWSCAHGIERWRSDCGCRIGGSVGSQAWRGPLRDAITWLRGECAAAFARSAADVFVDPTRAQHEYVTCLLEPAQWDRWQAQEVRPGVDGAGRRRAREALEMTRHALMMQTSCGWFFDELGGIEPAIILRHAARVIELVGRWGPRLEGGFLDRLRSAIDERAHVDGAGVYRRVVDQPRVTAATVAATSALLRALDAPADVPGYDVAIGPAQEGTAVVTERTTGARWNVYVRVAQDAQRGLIATTADGTLALSDIVPVARERVADTVSARIGEAMRQARVAARDRDVATVRDLSGAAGVLSEDVVAAAVPYLLDRLDVDDPSARDWARALAAASGLDRRALAATLERRLEAATLAIPVQTARMQLVLDVAALAGVTIDVTRAQVSFLRWWMDAPAAARGAPLVTHLLDRLGIDERAISRRAL